MGPQGIGGATNYYLPVYNYNTTDKIGQISNSIISRLYFIDLRKYYGYLIPEAMLALAFLAGGIKLSIAIFIY